MTKNFLSEQETEKINARQKLQQLKDRTNKELNDIEMQMRQYMQKPLAAKVRNDVKKWAENRKELAHSQFTSFRNQVESRLRNKLEQNDKKIAAAIPQLEQAELAAKKEEGRIRNTYEKQLAYL